MLSNISFWQLGIILLIVVLIFGTKKLRQAGSDIGLGIRGIKDGFKSDDTDPSIEDIANEIGEARRAAKRAARNLSDDEPNGFGGQW